MYLLYNYSYRKNARNITLLSPHSLTQPTNTTVPQKGTQGTPSPTHAACSGATFQSIPQGETLRNQPSTSTTLVSNARFLSFLKNPQNFALEEMAEAKSASRWHMWVPHSPLCGPGPQACCPQWGSQVCSPLEASRPGGRGCTEGSRSH